MTPHDDLQKRVAAMSATARGNLPSWIFYGANDMCFIWHPCGEGHPNCELARKKARAMGLRVMRDSTRCPPLKEVNAVLNNLFRVETL